MQLNKSKPAFYGRPNATEQVTLLRQVFALTATPQYDLWKNVLSRLEARWDHAADGTIHLAASCLASLRARTS